MKLDQERIEVRCGRHGGQDQTVMRRGSTKPAVFSTAILNTKLKQYVTKDNLKTLKIILFHASNFKRDSEFKKTLSPGEWGAGPAFISMFSLLLEALSYGNTRM